MSEFEPCPTHDRLIDPDPATIAHVLACSRCQRVVRSLRPTCSDPALGLLLSTRRLGISRLPAGLQEHLETCLACALERLALQNLDDGAITPDVDWTRRVKNAFGKL